VESVFVFVVIGLLTGGAARLLYPNRQYTHILGTLLIGTIGAIAGGMISWSMWPAVSGEYHTGNLVLSTLGAMMAIGLWAGVAYKRSHRSKHV
jgi:uncharacterized membrane protein YeaQ/YmgE (transglycosylase-associated protein family)